MGRKKTSQRDVPVVGKNATRNKASVKVKATLRTSSGLLPSGCAKIEGREFGTAHAEFGQTKNRANGAAEPWQSSASLTDRDSVGP